MLAPGMGLRFSDLGTYTLNCGAISATQAVFFFNMKCYKKNLENTDEQKEVNHSGIFSEAGEMAQLFSALAALPRTLV